jgi:hypothetical protein
MKFLYYVKMDHESSLIYIDLHFISSFIYVVNRKQAIKIGRRRKV